jgi:hypothetical protein
MPHKSWCKVAGGYSSPFDFLVSTTNLGCLFKVWVSVHWKMSLGIGSFGLWFGWEIFLQSWKFLRAQFVIFAVFAVAVADLGWFLGFHGTPLWAGPSTKKYYTDTSDRLKWNPPSLATQLRKLLWLTSACFSRKFVRKQVDWTCRFSPKRAWFYAKWAWLLKFCARFPRPFKKSTV